MKTSVYRNTKSKWVCDYYSAGKRHRSFHPTKAAADEAALSARDQARTTGEVWLALTASERMEAAGIMREVKTAGYTLRQVWDGFQANTGNAVANGKPLSEAIREVIAAKKTAGRRPNYIANLTRYLDRFARGRESAPIGSIGLAQIQELLANIENGNSRATLINRLGTLFSYAMKQGWITRNPIDRVEHIRVDQAPVRFLKPEEAEKLIRHVQQDYPGCLPWLALTMFAGIRPEECDKLTPDAINLNAATVTLGAGIAKTHRRRIVHLQRNGVAWLRAAGEMKIASYQERRWMQSQARAILGWKSWPVDILRKTAATYLMARDQNAARVADELGNSPGILLRHYRGLASKADAERFFAIMPA